MYKISIVLETKTNTYMKKILILLLLIGISSCCEDEDIRISWNVGVYHDATVGAKYLTVELLPSEGRITDVEISVLWIFCNGDRKREIRHTNSDFNFDYYYDRGLLGRSREPQNYILDDYSYSLIEVEVMGRFKINGEWYKVSERRTF